jgi:dTDP-4-amino-4,6-dideoxygalactose transaminase
MDIPLVDINAQYQVIGTEIDAAFREVMATSKFILGEKVAEFETMFAEAIGAEYVIGVASGTAALNLAVEATAVGPGDEVITVPNTWISTAFAATARGAKVVLVDIDKDTLQMDPAKLEAALTSRTKAVIPVHMYGHPAPMTAIEEICRRRGVSIIEDVAQAPMARVDGRMTGSFGDVACFSFYPGKNLGCLGDGGAIATNDADIAARVKSLRNYGQSAPHRHEEVGYNARLDALQAAVLSVKLPYLAGWNRARRACAGQYLEALKDLPVWILQPAAGVESAAHLFPIQLDNRDACLTYLRDNGIMSQIHYPTPIHLQPCYEDLGYGIGDFPNAESYSERTLSLPLYPELTNGQIRRVVDTLKNFLVGCEE